MAKKASKKSTGSTASRSPAKADSGSRAGGDRLLGAVYHNGRVYDHRKASDQEAFKKAVEEDKRLGDKNKDGSPRARIDLQNLADSGAVSGYGTKASAKGKRAAERADEEGLDEEQDPNAPAGGGIDAVEEQELREEELEEQEEER